MPKNQNLKNFLGKKFPTGDLPFLVSVNLFVFTTIFATKYSNLGLFKLGAVFGAIAFFYAIIWMPLYNYFLSKKE